MSESNSSLEGDTFKEQFVYPKNEAFNEDMWIEGLQISKPGIDEQKIEQTLVKIIQKDPALFEPAIENLIQNLILEFAENQIIPVLKRISEIELLLGLQKVEYETEIQKFEAIRQKDTVIRDLKNQITELQLQISEIPGGNTVDYKETNESKIERLYEELCKRPRQYMISGDVKTFFGFTHHKQAYRIMNDIEKNYDDVIQGKNNSNRKYIAIKSDWTFV